MNDDLVVRYVLDSTEVIRTMNQVELACFLLEDDVFLLSVNEQIGGHTRKKKGKGCNPSSRYK